MKSRPDLISVSLSNRASFILFISMPLVDRAFVGMFWRVVRLSVSV